MDENIAALRQQIEQYEAQLSQIQLAVAASAPGPDQENLVLLRADLEELITLTKENLTTLENKAKGPQEPTDDFDKEYALFKAELQEVEGSSSQTASTTATSISSDIEGDLEDLRGMKCQAPHRLPWGEIGFHNALVFGPESSDEITCLNDIKVRVMFTNPMHADMLPCPYFLEGECRFSDAQCRYSHGDVVQLSQLREYKEPNFSAVQPGVRVLVQQDDKLWHRGVIVSCGQNKCEVKLEKTGKQNGVDLQHILPLDDPDNVDDDEDDDTDDSSSSNDSESDAERVSAEIVEKSLLNTPPSTALGEWEKHTTGIGSRLMAQMGYVTGTGLGKNGEGRIEPVEVMVFPTGRSLDHCMQLRELSGGDEDLFKVEKKLKRLQKKHQQQSERQYEREKQKTNVFDFINSKLGAKSGKNESTSSNRDKTLKSETSRGLNVVGFQVGEEIRRAERDLVRLQESLSRQSAGSASHSAISSKVEDKQGELARLRASEVNIDRERNQRKDRKKLSVF